MTQYLKVLESSTHHGSSSSFTIEVDDEAHHRPKVEVVDPSRLSNASFALYWFHKAYSTITFSWVLPLLIVGNSNRRLDPTDLLHLEAMDTAAGCYRAFSEQWNLRKHGKRASLALSFAAAFGFPFAVAGLLKLAHDLLLFVGPQVLSRLILFLKDPNIPLNRGLELVLVLFVSQFAMSVFLRQYFFACFRVGMRIRSAVVTSVYSKTLGIATGAFARKSTGEVQNLMAVDSTRLQDLTAYVHAIWYSVVQIALALWLLWGQVGVASLAAITVIVLTIPLTGKVSTMLKNIQQRVVLVRDERIKLTNEVLGGIKVLKLQAWEGEFEGRINALRDRELTLYREYVLTQALSGTLFTVIPLLVAISTFGAFVFTGHNLTVEKALTSLALFDLLRFPLFMLPNTINSIVEAQVSLGRIQTYLQEPERVPVPSLPLRAPGLLLDKVTAVWDGVGRSVRAGEAAEVPVEARLWSRAAAHARWLCRLMGCAGEDAKPSGGSGGGSGSSPLHAAPPAEQGAGATPAQDSPAASASKSRWRQLDAAQYEELLMGELAAANEQRIASLEAEVAALRRGADKGGADADDSITSSSNSNSSGGGGNVGVGGTRLLALSRLTLSVSPGELVAIVGPVGSGKSSLLLSVLGELRVLFGSVACKGSLAIVGQRPFIFNSTVKENIINLLPLDDARYAKVCAACALVPDFAVLPAGDLTEIGERGINLSGGQKTRVALARAVYSDADVFLLDDICSAVDAHTAAHLLEHCVLPLRERGKAVLLCTNALQVLPACSRVAVLDGGKIVQLGSFDELRREGRARSAVFADMMAAYTQTLSRDDGPGAGSELDGAGGADEAQEPSAPPSAVPLQPGGPVDKQKERAEKAQEGAAGRLVEAEDREIGHVSKEVYLVWLRAAGGAVVGVVLVLLFMLSEMASVGSSIWLAFWSEHHAEYSSTFFLGVYTLLCLAIAALMAAREIFTRLSAWRAGERLFRDFLGSVLLAPMSFFDTTPLGRVINRFSKDIYCVDEQLPQTVRWYIQSLTKVAGAVLYVCVVSPFFIVCMVPIVFYYRYMQAFFLKTSRELSRLDSVSRSPIYALFGETIDGLPTVRAFRMEAALCRRIDALLDANQRAYFCSFAANCWLAFRLEFAGTFIVTAAALLAVLGRPSGVSDAANAGAGQGTSNETYAGLAGLAISMCLSITQSINWSVRMASDLESQMVGVERLREYIEAPREAAHFLPLADPPRAWPSQGAVRFSGVSMRYREGLPLVLRNVSLDIRPREKIGICGRTGSGKSSLVTALLRLVESSAGSIFIDGVDIAEIGLHALRSRISFISQDPCLFSGDIRTNLDPFNLYSDDKVREGLRRIGLAGCGLSDKVEENGQNFSVGQRQMLCIVRALLGDCKIIVMDESTANVDIETDQQIQRAIREEFKEATVFTIAHRINTILDSTRVVVMDAGTVLEFDSPASLLANPSSAFAQLVASWEADK